MTLNSRRLEVYFRCCSDIVYQALYRCCFVVGDRPKRIQPKSNVGAMFGVYWGSSTSCYGICLVCSGILSLNSELIFREFLNHLLVGPFSILKFEFLPVTLYRETIYFLILALVIGKPCCARYLMYCWSAASSSPSKIGAGPFLFVGYIPISLSVRFEQAIPKISGNLANRQFQFFAKCNCCRKFLLVVLSFWHLSGKFKEHSLK